VFDRLVGSTVQGTRENRVVKKRVQGSKNVGIEQADTPERTERSIAGKTRRIERRNKG
jgi:hypothetical protein